MGSVFTKAYLVLYIVKILISPKQRTSNQIRSSAWLEHYTDNVGVTSSNLVGSTYRLSSSAWIEHPDNNRGGHQFKSGRVYKNQLANLKMLQFENEVRALIFRFSN
jgi:hypothetical protein